MMLGFNLFNMWYIYINRSQHKWLFVKIPLEILNLIANILIILFSLDSKNERFSASQAELYQLLVSAVVFLIIFLETLYLFSVNCRVHYGRNNKSNEEGMSSAKISEPNRVNFLVLFIFFRIVNQEEYTNMKLEEKIVLIIR